MNKYRIVKAHFDWAEAVLQIRPLHGLTRDYSGKFGTPRYRRILLAISYAALIEAGN